MSNPSLVTVGRAYGGSVAALAMAMLESSGIRVSPHPWHTLAVSWHLTHALGGIELQVPASQAEHAAAILADFQVTRRPKNKLLFLLFSIIVWAWLAVPPPAFSFFAAFRPTSTRVAAVE